MLKQIIYLIIASIVVILLASYLNQLLQWGMAFYDTLIGWLATIFSSNWIGTLLTKLLALFLIPLVITGLISGIYWIFKRKKLASFVEIMWFLWIVLATMLVTMR